MKTLIVLISIVLLPFTAIAQDDFCRGLADYDNDVDGTDAAEFKSHFGRSGFSDPCPPDGPAPVPKTGQTTSYTTGDDGEHQRGVSLVTPRFTDNGDGTVTDNQTGLIWMKNADCFGLRTWYNAVSDSNGLADGQCGLTDGSNAGDWRLPNIRELNSLVDFGQAWPVLSLGHPFQEVQITDNLYWSSTSYCGDEAHSPGVYAWRLSMKNGNQGTQQAVKTSEGYVWCVRGGH